MQLTDFDILLHQPGSRFFTNPVQRTRLAHSTIRVLHTHSVQSNRINAQSLRYLHWIATEIRVSVPRRALWTWRSHCAILHRNDDRFISHTSERMTDDYLVKLKSRRRIVPIRRAFVTEQIGIKILLQSVKRKFKKFTVLMDFSPYILFYYHILPSVSRIIRILRVFNSKNNIISSLLSVAIKRLFF